MQAAALAAGLWPTGHATHVALAPPGDTCADAAHEAHALVPPSATRPKPAAQPATQAPAFALGMVPFLHCTQGAAPPGAADVELQATQRPRAA